jgi:RNA polymerase sigma factor (sigma-70 family)
VTSILRFPSAARQEDGYEPPADEARLIEAVRSGDRDAAEKLVELTYTAVYGSLHKLCGGNSDLAADLTQETYRRAWSALASFRGRARMTTWLYRIAYTTFLNHIRRPARVLPMDEQTAATARDPNLGADEMLAEKEETEHLRRAVLKLPEDLRFTVTAHFWGGLDVAEIAETEGLTGAAIRKRLRKAFALLAVSMNEESKWLDRN